jgi:hypothetical protein
VPDATLWQELALELERLPIPIEPEWRRSRKAAALAMYFRLILHAIPVSSWP